MLLRKMEAYGFKSFADKTCLEFGPGITAIVGPNGSGKSNIADAIRWVLGEQSIRNLRGARMEDVIFAGSSERRAMGVAEVSLIFDNTDGVLPVDFSEVVITRRVFRSGDSEYYINKAQCRLRDIHELLADTGLGRESMTVISQNKIDEVLNSRPEERRLIFEEAAEITKYKQRKKDALRKMDDTEQNLKRVADILTEIDSNLLPLAESAERTKRYNILQERLVSCQVTILLERLVKAEKMVESARLQEETLADQDISINTRIIGNDVEKERIATEIASFEAKLLQSEQSLRQHNTDLERLDGKTAVLEERIHQGTAARERLIAEELGHQDTDSQLREKTDEMRRNLLLKQHQEAQQQALLASQQSELQSVLENIREREAQLQQGNEDSFGHLQELVTQRNSLRVLDRDEQEQRVHLSALRTEYANYCQQVTENELQVSEYLSRQKDLNDNIQELQLRGMALQNRRKSQAEKALQLDEQEKKLLAEGNQLNSRQKVLSDMQREYEGFGRGIKNVLKSNLPWRSRVCGAVAQVINVPEQYVIAIEVALGNALQHIITEDDRAAQEAIGFLKDHNLGRATFLPLNTIQVMLPRAFENKAVQLPGAIGFASSLVQCEARYQRVVEFLLGRTIVARTIEEALTIAKQSSFTVRIVTLDGEVVHPGGSLTGGSTHRRETSYLSRTNEIQTLTDRIFIIRKEAELVAQQLQSCRNELILIDSERNDLDKRRQEYDISVAEQAVHLEKALLEKKRFALAVETLKNELTSGDKEIMALKERLNATQEQIEVLENRGQEHQKQVLAWQVNLKQLQEDKENLQDNVTETKINLSALNQEVTVAATTVCQLEKDTRFLAEKLVKLATERTGIDDQLEKTIREIAANVLQRAALQTQKMVEEQQHGAFQEAKMALLVAAQKIDKDLKELRRKYNDIQSNLHEARLWMTQYGYEINTYEEQLRDHFHFTREEAKSLLLPHPIEKLNSDIQELENDIACLGPVNPQAILEHARLLDRYQFLKNQYDDLINARNSLSAIISDIDSIMNKQFIAAFRVIQELFGDIFVRLFGGGQAHLQLIDSDDILNTGIEITVQPPGKKQQNLALLSGGERALTVIALLFAFLSYRPAPFCVVDEIDAALDEANVQRFSEFLRDYARSTQFIVVTHRKGTMEVADVMHGTTMEEAGVTRLVSVKFLDQAG